MLIRDRLIALGSAVVVSSVSLGRASAQEVESGHRSPRTASLGAATGVAVLHDTNGSRYAAPVAMFHVGLQFPIGLRPELVISYAGFAADSQSSVSNFLFLAPGARFQLPDGPVRPWIAAHFDVGTFSLGASCIVADQRTFDTFAPQKGCDDQTGLHLGVDAGVGVDWVLSRRWSIGTQLGWTYTRPSNPPKQDPAPAGYPAATEKDYVKTWVLLAAGLTVRL